MARLVMVIDTQRCTGCHACALACKLENNLPDGIWWNRVYTGVPEDFTGDRATFTEGRIPEDNHLKIDIATGSMMVEGGLINSKDEKNVTMTYWTKACQHCDEPACLPVCPTSAIYQDADTGVVDANMDECIGCRACNDACPYDVRAYNVDELYTNPYAVGNQGINKHSDNTVEKCTLCHHRLIEQEKPACVDCCPANARHIGSLNDVTSEVYHLLFNSNREHVQLLPEKGTKPAVYFVL